MPLSLVTTRSLGGDKSYTRFSVRDRRSTRKAGTIAFEIEQHELPHFEVLTVMYGPYAVYKPRRREVVCNKTQAAILYQSFLADPIKALRDA